jgi:hypothetical protein
MDGERPDLAGCCRCFSRRWRQDGLPLLSLFLIYPFFYESTPFFSFDRGTSPNPIFNKNGGSSVLQNCLYSCSKIRTQYGDGVAISRLLRPPGAARSARSAASSSKGAQGPRLRRTCPSERTPTPAPICFHTLHQSRLLPAAGNLRAG